MSKIMCEICGSEFNAIVVGNNHYVARENSTSGISTIIENKEDKLYDAFDCPVCKCQNIIGERKRSILDDLDDILPVDDLEEKLNEDEDFSKDFDELMSKLAKAWRSE